MRENWTETTLGDAVTVQKGKKPPALVASGKSSHPYLTADVLRGAKCGQFVPDDVVGPCIQLNGRETVLLWDGAGAGDVFRSQLGVLASTMAKLVARDSHLIDDGYLFLFLNSKQATIKSSCRGTTVPHVSPEALKSLKLPLPPLLEQERIVNLVSSVDSYIAALQQQADAARAARNAVLSELLSTGGEDWSESSVHDVLAVSIGGVWGSNPGVDEIDVYVYRQTEFGNDGRLTMPSDAVRSITHKQFKSRVLQPGDVLMQKSAGTPTLPGRVVIVPPGIESNATCSNFLHLLKSDTDRCTPQFLFWFLWLSYKSGRAFEFQRGTNIRNLDLNEYLDQSMMLPPLAEQKRIVDIASSMDQALQSTERAVLGAKRLRSGLLSDLLSGDHEIPESYDRLMGAA